MVRKQRVIPAVEAGGDEVVVTKRGRPVAKLVPIETERPRIPRRDFSHLVEFVGDVMSPLDVEWDAIK